MSKRMKRRVGMRRRMGSRGWVLTKPGVSPNLSDYFLCTGTSLLAFSVAEDERHLDFAIRYSMFGRERSLTRTPFLRHMDVILSAMTHRFVRSRA